MKYPEDQAEIEALAEYLKTNYQGNFEHMKGHLYEIMGMFHFIDPEVFSHEKVKEKVYVLFRLLECLNERNK
jgi:hypothetical protein